MEQGARSRCRQFERGTHALQGGGNQLSPRVLHRAGRYVLTVCNELEVSDLQNHVESEPLRRLL